jgi:hypothetical protein
VQDYQLEKRLRQPCESYIKRSLASQLAREDDQQDCLMESSETIGLPEIVYELVQVKLPQINLNKITETNSRQYNPRLLTNLLLGYLKLG